MMTPAIRNILAIARKELSIYFTTPWAYVVLTAVAGFSSFFFLFFLEAFRGAHARALLYGWARLPPDDRVYKNLTDGVVVQLWGAVTFLMLVVVPLLSMRLFSEEKRQRTFELLMTAPVRPWEIVLGKYLGGLGVVGSAVGLNIVFPLLLTLYGNSESGHALEWSTVVLGFVGLALVSAICLALGMFISSLTESQMLAAMLTWVVMFVLMGVELVIPGTGEPWRSIATQLSVDTHLQRMFRGVLDTRSLVFFASLILLSLVLTQRSLEAQRWT